MAIVKSSLSTRGSKHGLMRQETHVEDDSTGYSEKPAESVMISAVIPVFNEQEVIDEFSTRLIESLEHMVPTMKSSSWWREMTPLRRSSSCLRRGTRESKCTTVRRGWGLDLPRRKVSNSSTLALTTS